MCPKVQHYISTSTSILSFILAFLSGSILSSSSANFYFSVHIYLRMKLLFPSTAVAQTVFTPNVPRKSRTCCPSTVLPDLPRLECLETASPPVCTQGRRIFRQTEASKPYWMRLSLFARQNRLRIYTSRSTSTNQHRTPKVHDPRHGMWNVLFPYWQRHASCMVDNCQENDGKHRAVQRCGCLPIPFSRK